MDFVFFSRASARTYVAANFDFFPAYRECIDRVHAVCVNNI